MAFSKASVLALVCLAVVIPASQGALMAIDVGSEFLKVSLVQPGRTPIEIVTNEMSKRKTPAVIAFSNGERLMGEEAAAINARYPERVYSRVRDMLGKPLSDPSIQAMLKSAYLPYVLVEDPVRNTIRIKTHTGEEYSVEEIMASILHYCHKIAEAHAGSVLREAVITVPAFFGQNQRQAILDSAEMAGLDVLSLISEHSAAALVFGIDRVSNITQDVVLYDVGANSVTASYVQYSSWTGKEFGKKKEFGQFVVKDVRFDENVGGEKLDHLLTEHFVDEFNAEWKGGDIREFPKAMAKLKKQVKRTKEILSANNEAPISVEGLHDDRDFRSTIKRETFENLAKDFFPAMVKPLRDVMEANNLTSNPDLLVEMLGGTSRVPRVQAALTEVLGEIPLSKHLDADEAVAWGAGLHAANLSTAFRVRKFGMTDGAMYPLELEMEQEGQDEVPEGEEAEAPAADADAGSKRRTLLPRMKKLPVKRIVSLPGVEADEVKLQVYYKEGEPLPPGATTDLLGDWTISGIVNASKRYNTTIGTPKVNVHFEVSRSGILELTKAEAVVEMMESYWVDVPKNKTDEEIQAEEEAAKKEAEEEAAKEAEEEAAKKEAEEGEDATKAEEGEGEKAAPAEEGEGAKNDEAASEEGEDAKKGEEGEEEGDKKKNATKADKKKPKKKKPKVEYVKVKKERKRTTRLALEVGGPGITGAVSGEVLVASTDVLKDLRTKDVIKAENAEAKNSLEDYSISTREKLSESEDVEKVTTEESREEFRAQLMDAEDWLYGDGENAPTEDLRAKLVELKEVGDAIFFRASELERRPEAMEKARKFCEQTRELVAKWREDRPYINATELDDVDGMLNSAEEWMNTHDEEQAKRELYEEPAFTAKEVDEQMRPIDMTMRKLSKRKPPPPPKAPKKNATEANATDGGAGGDGSASDAGGEAAEEGAAGAADEGAAGEEGAPAAEEGAEEGAAADEGAAAASDEGAAGEEGGKEGEEEGEKGKGSSFWGSRDSNEL